MSTLRSTNISTYKEQLVITQSLYWFFFNFTNDQIEELKQVREFAHVWEKIRGTGKRKKPIITAPEMFGLYNSVGYNTQAEIMRVAITHYEAEARKSIDFSIEIEMKRENLTETK